jgi:hypothetical protein
MAITYTRNITNLVVKDVEIDGTTLTDAITQVSWDYTGTNANNVSGTFHGTMTWDRDPTRYMSANNFTSYSSVTEQNVWDWVDARTTPDYLEHQKDIVKSEINRQKAQTEVESGNFPWQS